MCWEYDYKKRVSFIELNEYFKNLLNKIDKKLIIYRIIYFQKLKEIDEILDERDYFQESETEMIENNLYRTYLQGEIDDAIFYINENISLEM
jgi:hypothetical protein